MRTKKHSISVIIPSRGRMNALCECLAALSAQTQLPDEVIVVENDTRKTYRNLRQKFPKLPLVHVLEKTLGRSVARNTGMKKASKEIFAFLDDDCIPHSNWIEKICADFATKKSIDAVLGHSQERNQSTLMRAFIFQHEQYFMVKRIDPNTGNVLCGSILNTRNFAVRREVVEKHQLQFNPIYDFLGFAEDTEFGECLERHGALMWYDQDLVVEHTESDDLWKMLQKRFRNGRAIAILQSRGFIHEFPYSVANARFDRWLIVKNVWQNSLFPNPFFMIYLDLVTTVYRWGVTLQQIINAIPNKKEIRILNERMTPISPSKMFLATRQLQTINFLDLHIFAMFCKSYQFRKAFLKNTHIYPEGWWSSLVLRALGLPTAQRKSAAKVLKEQWQKWKSGKIRILFLGGIPEVSNRFFHTLSSETSPKVLSQMSMVPITRKYKKTIFFHHGYVPSQELLQIIKSIKPKIVVMEMDGSEFSTMTGKLQGENQLKLIWNTKNLFSNVAQFKNHFTPQTFVEWWEKTKESMPWLFSRIVFDPLVVLCFGIPLIVFYRFLQEKT